MTRWKSFWTIWNNKQKNWVNVQKKNQAKFSTNRVKLGVEDAAADVADKEDKKV